ncbi:hypothetical protein CAG70_13025 [Photobacterium halotolerans]|uniref:hypothetical protein n=1 Tax=Photobacterium halotolerans TaxID=265726 RepID=UPI0013733973|nr:hypothetical protein [Photobacterium halotolerans]NAX47904.1 hypothetical protein [Photobacterium halotolerans]
MFEVGKKYHRQSEVHGVYKGQAQGGISTPLGLDAIFILPVTAMRSSAMPTTSATMAFSTTPAKARKATWKWYAGTRSF